MARDLTVDKVIQIDQELCAGCGACIDACSVGAINLMDHQVEIDYALCTSCEACLDTCPNGAIIAITAPTRITPITVQSMTSLGLNHGQQALTLPGTTVPVGGLKSMAGAALAFLASEVAPRLVDVVMKSIEHRLAQTATTTISPSIPSSRNYGLQSRGQRKQIRHRGGGMGNRKLKGRR